MRETTRTVPALLAAVLLLAGGLAAQTNGSAQALLRTAMDTAAVDGDLSAAIEQYQTIVEAFETDRAVVAAALVQMGGLYEKLGDDRFHDAYESVLRDYADQPAPVATVLARLAVLDDAARFPTMTVRELMRSDEPLSGGELRMPGKDFVMSSDGQHFVYTDFGSGDLARMNMVTGERETFYGVSWLYDANSSGPVESFSSPVFSPDDSTVAFVRYSDCGCDDTVTTRIDVDSPEGGRRETVYDFNDLRQVVAHDWSPDGEHILFSSAPDDGSVFLATLSLTDHTVQRLVTLDWAHPSRAQYSPDGRYIAYESTKGGDRKIYLISADGTQERVLVDSSGEDDEPLWTRDGRFLLFRTNRSGKWDLHALRMENGQPVGDDILIKGNLGTESHLRGMTTDGQLYYFELVSAMDAVIADRIDDSTKTLQARILPKVLVADTRAPAFGPKGQRLAYVAGRSSRDPHINITDLEGKIQQAIRFDRQVRPDRPMFSPDGHQLGVVLYEAGELRLGLVSLETGTLLKLFSPLEQELGGYFWFLGWSRDSRHLYFLVHGEDERALTVMDVETGQVVESSLLVPDMGMAHLSPSKEYLALWSRSSGRLMLRSLEDGSERQLKATQVGPFIAWDSDSRSLLYQKNEGNQGLYSFSIDTEEERLLVEDMEDLAVGSVSPDGTSMVLTNNGLWDQRVWVLEHFLPESHASNDRASR